MSRALLQIENLSVRRGSRLVLDRVSAELPRGQTTALVGLNGSGKSTLLRTILGEFAYQGKLSFRCGHDHSRPRPDHVGYVPQKLTVDPRLPLTVRDLAGLALNRSALFFGTGKRAANFRHTLARFQVGDLLDRPVEGLSGGQLQRVLLALALEPSPELLLLDEPAAGIDFRSQADFYKLIGEINAATGVTVLLVSHDLALVRGFAQQAVCLRDGVVAARGPASEVLSDAAIGETYGAAAIASKPHPS